MFLTFDGTCFCLYKTKKTFGKRKDTLFISDCRYIFSTIPKIIYRYTAVSVLEMDFERIDINQCPVGLGNNGPNIFGDTARCKKETTEVRFFTLLQITLLV